MANGVLNNHNVEAALYRIDSCQPDAAIHENPTENNILYIERF